MLYRDLGKSGIKISTIGMGTWAIGGIMWGGTDEQESIAALQAGLDAGITLIDTAPTYGDGLSEQIVGKAIRGRNREDVIIATKVGPPWLPHGGPYYFESGGTQYLRNLHPDTIPMQLELTIKRIGIDYVDLYQTHWQDPTTPIADTMAALLKLKEQGKIRAIGVSNASMAQMAEYLAVGQISSNQPRYNMLDREIEQDALAFCREHDIAILSYSSLEMGLLTGKMPPEREFPEGDHRAGLPRFSPENRAKVCAMLDQLAPFREKYRLDQTQLTIAWTISRPGVTCALVGVRNPQQARGIAPGGDVVISPEDLAAMDRIIASLGAV